MAITRLNSEIKEAIIIIVLFKVTSAKREAAAAIKKLIDMKVVLLLSTPIKKSYKTKIKEIAKRMPVNILMIFLFRSFLYCKCI